MLDVLQRYRLFANLKKCRFHKDKVRFLGYVILAQGVKIEDKQIEAVKNLIELKSVQDIQVFIGFANFYQRFIQSFSRIVASLISILKITGSSDSALKLFRAYDDKVVRVDGRANETFKNLSKSKKTKNDKSENLTHFSGIGAMRKPIFLTPGTKEALTV